ncbi:hypothetical protein PFFCH_05313 [Plasmodium falciparum FCH/4]|uniref:Plasmodium RESA N-terminal domain-containing protein n=2 Tax=Plasmodium falciparum TaxID=5833 RepID=A0A024VEV0_PLAFA|nr:hypothetical protein PFFCH_05313 [Plasmodium falciparum FCH/4]ETW43493.1 hypothetical protein PFNF135_02406 [Plasmodium falciparum NF135/5.C10]
MYGGFYHIYKRNLLESENVEHSGVRDEKYNNIPFVSNTEDDIKYDDVIIEKKCDNINYNDLPKQLTLEELHNVLDNLEEHPSKEDLYRILYHVLSITKEEFDYMLT